MKKTFSLPDIERSNKSFELVSRFSPAGDQSQAIDELVAGLKNGKRHQTLLGVTGSGKTFTMANMIAALSRPAVVMAPNKTLAAQLYGEFKQFFPNNAVHYFVSYYDFYQPEAYVPGSDIYIEKDASINAHIEQMRLAATNALLTRNDTLIIASVSSIYGIGAPEEYIRLIKQIKIGDAIDVRGLVRRLVQMQFVRTHGYLDRGQFRVRGELIDLFPADSEDTAYRLELFEDEVSRITAIDPLTGQVKSEEQEVVFFPKSHYATSADRIREVINEIKEDLKERIAFFESQSRWVEAQRLRERVSYDIEMMLEMGYCNGIEHYSRYLSGANVGEPPPTLFNYVPHDAILFVDESHVTIPQIGAMSKGDRARKENLVQYGFRLPAALDNRPLQFEEFESIAPPMVLVSATPGDYEKTHSPAMVEQLIRPTGIIDPEIIIRPAAHQVDDFLSVAHEVIAKKERILVTVLTKRMAEDLTEFLKEAGIAVTYLHSDIDSVERMAILQRLREGVFDVLVGINLLREGLDLPEVSLVCIFDADHQGFLRSARSLIQTIGRAARHIHGRVILYADKRTPAIETAISETDRRRAMQSQFNKKHGITPQPTYKPIIDIMESGLQATETDEKTAKKKNIAMMQGLPEGWRLFSEEQISKLVQKRHKAMEKAAEKLDFEAAAQCRDQIKLLEMLILSR